MEAAAAIAEWNTSRAGRLMAANQMVDAQRAAERVAQRASREVADSDRLAEELRAELDASTGDANGG